MPKEFYVTKENNKNPEINFTSGYVYVTEEYFIQTWEFLKKYEKECPILNYLFEEEYGDVIEITNEKLPALLVELKLVLKDENIPDYAKYTLDNFTNMCEKAINEKLNFYGNGE